MASGNATLVAWSLVGDLPWMTVTPRGFKQKGAPKPGETVSWLEKEMARVKAHIAEQNLKIVKTPDDIDLALKGVPHVVLSVEGASFLDEGISQLQAAYDHGHPPHPARALHPQRASATSRPSGRSTAGSPSSARRSCRNATGSASSSISRTAPPKP